jgi:hypothetical protein
MVSGFLARPPGEWGAQKRNLGRDNASTKLNGMDSLLDFKPTRQVNKIIHGHAPNKQREEQNKLARDRGNKGRTSEDKVDGRELPRELLDNGQGKSFSLHMDISTSSKENAPPLATTDTTMPLGCTSSDIINVLSPPIIVATGNITTGATTDKLHKQNRQYRDEALVQQSVVSQWSIHRGDTILAEDHWVRCINTAEHSKMALQGLALKHEAADILKDWAQFGCPTNMGRDWTLAEIQSAINQGPHKSALEPDALAHFAAGVWDKVKKGQARVVRWDNKKEIIHGNSKSPQLWQSVTSIVRTAQSSTYLLHFVL